MSPRPVRSPGAHSWSHVETRGRAHAWSHVEARGRAHSWSHVKAARGARSRSHVEVRADGHADDLDAALASVAAPAANGGSTGGAAEAPAGAAFLDGAADYELVGFVSHMGGNTGCANKQKETRPQR
eukprot:1177557-Prorocentrum_minimum.AAC.4